MPRAKHQTTLVRQWDLMRKLPSHSPGFTAADMRQLLLELGHEVTKRTVERDLQQLATIFHGIHCNDLQIPYGWYWRKGSQVEFGAMSQIEALGLSLTEQVIERLLPPDLWVGLGLQFSKAKRLLGELTDNPNTHWSELLHYEPPGLPFAPPVIEDAIFETVQKALIHGKRLEMDYQSRDETSPKKRSVNPLGILLQGVRPYLVASLAEDQPPHLYALQRIHRAVELEETVVKPKHFSLKAFAASGGGQFGYNRKTIQLKAIISQPLAKLLEETPLAADQKITRRKETIHLSASVKHSWQLDFWIRSQGPEIIVKSPKFLKDDTIRNLKTAMANYDA